MTTVVIGDASVPAALFPTSWVGPIIDLLLVAWADTKKPDHSELEPPVNARFCCAVRKRASEADLPFEVLPTFALFDDSGVIVALLDIVFLDCDKPNRNVYLAFECKRLNIISSQDGHRRSRAEDYIGEEGLGRYVSQKYATGLSEAGMVGYVLDSDVLHARSRVDANLSKRATALALLQPPLLQRSSTCPEAPHVFESRHTVGGKTMTIHHLLLPCSP